jgi:hypothetical protein
MRTKFKKKIKIMELRMRLKKKTLRVKSYISSNFELKGTIEKKNQIHKRIQNKNKIQENEDQI